MRISRDQLNMGIALLTSQRSTCERAQVGCAISQDGRVVLTGYNGAPAGMPHCLDEGCIIGPGGGCVRCLHAEAGAISFAAKKGIPLEGATFYVTHAPCLDCARLIINAGIKTVFFRTMYRDDSGLKLLDEAGVIIQQKE